MSELYITIESPIEPAGSMIPDDYFPSTLLMASASFDPLPSQTRSADAAIEERHHDQWNELLALYQQVETEVPQDPNTTTRKDEIGEKLKSYLDSFMRGSNAVMQELSIVGAMHPVLQGAISAFQKVIQLDIVRRDNNKKALAMVAQMQGVLIPMLQLRNLNRDHMPKNKREIQEGQLKEVMGSITKSINECRSDIANFKTRHFMVKLFLANRFEKRFAAHMETFVELRNKLQSVVSDYLAIGMSSVAKQLDTVANKMDTFLKVFQLLDSPKERDGRNFMEEHGGPKECVKDPNLLHQLMSGTMQLSTKASAIYELQEQLKNALAEDLDTVLKTHYLRFEKMLEVENNNISNSLKLLSAHLDKQDISMDTMETKVDKVFDRYMIVQAIIDKHKDLTFHQIWTKMNLTSGSVKAKAFVLTLRDHISADDQSNVGTPITDTVLLPEEGADSNTLPPNARETSSDDWVLNYMDVAYVQPIVEAMDEDGSGFISIKEANRFAVARPEELSLLHWIAYWAAGWHINLQKYKEEIYHILLEMHKVLPLIHVANRAFVDEYLDDDSLRRVEAILRSLNPLPDTSSRDTELSKICDIVTESQTKRLKKNLDNVEYVIRGMDVMTIAGPGDVRVETWILPLLCLLLQRHLDIFHLAKTVVLDESEFETHLDSLKSVFAAFDGRRKNLEAKFRSLQQDIEAKFQTFSYGMFHASFKGTELDVLENTLSDSLSLLKMDENRYLNNTRSLASQSYSTSIFSNDPIGASFQYEELDLSPPEPVSADRILHPIEGTWFGWSSSPDHMDRNPYRCVIHPIVGKTLKGKGEIYFGSLDITGELHTEATSSTAPIQVSLKIHQLDQICFGTYDPQRDVIGGRFDWMDGDSSESEGMDGDEQDNMKESDLGENENVDRSERRFYFTRTPPDIFRFRYLLDRPSPPPSSWKCSEIARKRWLFASEAIRFQTRLRLGPGKYFKQVLSERRKWLPYAIRCRLTNDDADDSDDSDSSDLAEYESLSDREWDDYMNLINITHPTIARMFEAIAEYMTRRRAYSVGDVACDACGKCIAFTRHQCIVCMKNDGKNQIDLCENCFDKPSVVLNTGSFTHYSSHSLLRSRQFIHAFEVKTLITESRKISEISKSYFKPPDATKAGRRARSRKGMKGKEVGNLTSEKDLLHKSPQYCACCNKQVSTPCWVCVSCVPLTFICDECDRQNTPVVQISGRRHSRQHHLLWIHDSVEVKTVKTNAVERQLDEINSDIKTQLEEVKGEMRRLAVTVGGEDGENIFQDSDDESNYFADLPLDGVGLAWGSKSKGDETLIQKNQSGKEDDFKPPVSLGIRLTALETKVEGINQALDARYSILETKMDSILTTMQNLFSPMSPNASSKPNGLQKLGGW